MQPRRIGIESDCRAEQIDGLAEAAAAERKLNALARSPWIVRQMGGARKGFEGRGQIVIEMKVDPAQRGQQGVQRRHCRQSGMRSAARRTMPASITGDMKPWQAWATERLRKVHASRHQRWIEFDGAHQAAQRVLHPVPL